MEVNKQITRPIITPSKNIDFGIWWNMSNNTRIYNLISVPQITRFLLEDE